MAGEQGFWEKLRAGLARTREGVLGPLTASLRGGNAEELLSRLEEVLLSADVGPEEASRIAREVVASLPGRFSWEDLVAAVERELVAALRPAERALSLSESPAVLLFLGVNGSGKTTTVAKAARLFLSQGHRPLLVAADTFRAAAIDQLKELGTEAGAEVVAHRPGADPGAVVHDALEHAKSVGYDVVLVDTAGRLQTKKPLMEELGKIRRVVEKVLCRPPEERLLVVDATVGQNAISQAQLFHEAVGLTGLVITKLDGTARGGAVLPVVRALGLPIIWVGVGRSLEDLAPFQAQAFVQALLRG